MTKPLRILIVEDELPMQEALSLIIDPLLKHFEGSSLTKTGSLTEAMAIISKYPYPDIVILDLTLNDSGMEATIAKLDDIEERAPLVIVTGYQVEFVETLIKSARKYEIISKHDKSLASRLISAISSVLSSRYQRDYTEQVKRIERMQEIISLNERAAGSA